LFFAFQNLEKKKKKYFLKTKVVLRFDFVFVFCFSELRKKIKIFFGKLNFYSFLVLFFASQNLEKKKKYFYFFENLIRF